MDRFVSRDGDDGNPGTQVLPWRKLQLAIEQSVSTLYVRGGAYPEVALSRVAGRTGGERRIINDL